MSGHGYSLTSEQNARMVKAMKFPGMAAPPRTVVGLPAPQPKTSGPTTCSKTKGGKRTMRKSKKSRKSTKRRSKH